MAETIGARIAAYQPSKTIWFWTTLGAVVLTIIVGFAWGGWVTGGTATVRAETAAGVAVADLAANICAYRFLQAGDAGTQLTALKAESTWQRDAFVEDGGWVTFAGGEKPVKGAGEKCVDLLMQAELPAPATPVADATATEASAT
jgi:hypothetical protein